jgi:hypothetical protein
MKSPSRLNTVMARSYNTPRRKALTPVQKDSLSKTARNVAALSEMATDNLTPALHNRKMTDEHIEIILTRVSAGDTVKSICKSLGLSSGVLYSRCHNDPVLAQRLNIAQTIASHTLVDSMLEVVDDEDISVDRARLKIDAIKWIAARRNRNEYGDKVQHDVKQLTITLNQDQIDLI